MIKYVVVNQQKLCVVLQFAVLYLGRVYFCVSTVSNAT